MAENHCPPHFLPPTNQLFQQITYNNFQTPNNLPQQLNQSSQLGFGQFYHHDQHQKQQRVHVDQQISDSHTNVPNSNSFLPTYHFPVNRMGQDGNYGKVGSFFGEEEEVGLMMGGTGSEQFVLEGRNTNLPVANCWQGDLRIKQCLPYGKPLLTESFNGNKVYDQYQNKRLKHSEGIPLLDEPIRKIVDNNCRQVGNAEAIDKSQTFQDQLKGLNSREEKEGWSRDLKIEKEEEKKSDSGTQFESSMEEFFNSLMDRLAFHQESLHQRFLQTIERFDEERKEREEAWRKQELARQNQQAMERAHDQALASAREATIVSYLEKITGQSIIIPRKAQEIVVAGDTMNVNKRWPKIEVDALIKIRTSLEPKCHDPALKAFLWEEISQLMCSMGYRRSAQRCKEKWENINRYYKKAKMKQSFQKHKSCSYFQQLDQFYTSKPFINGYSPSSSSFSSMLQGAKHVPFGNVEEMHQKIDQKLNHQDEESEDEEEEDDDDEEESDVD